MARSDDPPLPPPPPKRICTWPISTGSPPRKQRPSLPDIQSILQLPEDVVWSLRKQDLRQYFVELQKYARDPYPLASPAPQKTKPTPQTSSQPPFLRLPREIREIIYTYLLPPPSNNPVRGPHPRQLQTNILLSQSFPPSVLLLNHQIHNEVVPLFYGAPTQVIHVTINYNVWAHKTQRGDLVVSSSITSAIKHLHLSIHLGSEKRNNKPDDVEAEVRMSEVKKGIKKLKKWLASADIESIVLSWQEPPQTFTWDQKKEILDGLKGLRAKRVSAGEINWGLSWNKGRRFRFEVEYCKELER